MEYPSSRKEAKEKGTLYYFTGKPCKNGHIDLRQTSNSSCKSCSKNYYSRYYYNNLDKQRERRKKWYHENKEWCYEYSKEWRLINKERYKKYNRQYKINNREYLLEYGKNWRDKNRDHRLEYGRKYREENCGKLRLLSSNRRAQITFSTPKWADQELMNLIYSECPDGHEVDHYYPLISDQVCGLHVQDNLRYLPICLNRSKINKMPEEFPCGRY